MNQEVFIKEYKRKGKRYTRSNENIIVEATKMYNTNHRNIVRFMGILVGRNHFYTVTEYMSNNSLYDVLHKSKQILDEKLIMKILVSISRAMNFLHGLG